MISSLCFVLVTAALGGVDDASQETQLLIDTIESLQKSVEDFRCEFEGKRYFRGKLAEQQSRTINDDGLFESFGGVFIWKNGGDTYSDSLVRKAKSGRISRESLAVRMREHKAESHYRENDASLGSAAIKSPNEINSHQPTCLGYIFLIDKIKRDVLSESLVASVGDDHIDGRPVKVLNFSLRNVPDSLLLRYWIDLRRSGHMVRLETFGRRKVLASRLEITLTSFNVENTEIWMPTFGENRVYVFEDGGKAAFATEPVIQERIYVVKGTMEFNKHPSSHTFTIKYKPGTPISDHLRKLTTEYGVQKIGVRPTKAALANMLEEQIAKAQEQKSELVVVADAQRFNWLPVLTWGLSGLLLLSLVILVIQRLR